VSSTPGTCGAFQKEGDKIWVRDIDTDGHSAVVEWQTFTSNGVLTRQGRCGQTAGAGKAGYCNKNFVEGTPIKLRACTYEWGTHTRVFCYSNGWVNTTT
jgi:hypothetical protein